MPRSSIRAMRGGASLEGGRCQEPACGIEREHPGRRDEKVQRGAEAVAVYALELRGERRVSLPAGVKERLGAVDLLDLDARRDADVLSGRRPEQDVVGA